MSMVAGINTDGVQNTTKKKEGRMPDPSGLASAAQQLSQTGSNLYKILKSAPKIVASNIDVTK